MEPRCSRCGRVLPGSSDRACPDCKSGTDDPAAADPTADSVRSGRLGRYRILQRVGVGSVASVYRARDEDLKRDVAIKIMHRRFLSSPNVTALFLAEAHALAELDHPGIIPIYDVGHTSEGGCYLVMKYLGGDSLRARLQRERFSCSAAADIVAQAAEALNHAHARGLVHRDVKPANLMFDDDRVVVTDFGLALRERDFGTGPNWIGTVPYMSPEQARCEGHRVDARSDVFSLGVVLYELMTGRRPFVGAAQEAVLEEIKTRVPDWPQDARIPPELERICLRALAKRAQDRYATAREFAEDLRHWQEEQKGVTDALAPAVAVVPRGCAPFTEEDAAAYPRLLPPPRDRQGIPRSIAFWKSRFEATASCRVVVLYGPGGSGKSSLVRAGVLPRLDPQVTAIYVDCVRDRFEARVLDAVRGHFPKLSRDLNLPATLQALRCDADLAGDAKVVVVLDQFEQCIGLEDSPFHALLADALRQCDGVRLQAMLVVRDEFWLSISRLMQDVEAPLIDGESCAAMDRFDEIHARNVLVDFGRALGCLPPGVLSPVQEQFLDAAVREFAVGEDVSPSHLSLFAELMRSTPWIPKTLESLRIAGDGVSAFLEASLGAGAPIARRPYASAARAILQALLPVDRVPVRAAPRRREELASVLPEGSMLPEVLRLLEQDLRLIAPVPAIGDDRTSAETYYLSHDYLIPALRRWLGDRRRETRRGRAERLLEEYTGFWSERPSRRRLPLWWEWIAIRCLTASRLWTPPQHRMMRAAGRLYLFRAAVMAAAVGVLMALAWAVSQRLAEERGLARAEHLRDQVQDFHRTSLVHLQDEARRDRRWALPLLQAFADSPTASPEDQLHARLVMLPLDPNQAAPLSHLMLSANHRDFMVARDALQMAAAPILPDLWRRYLNQGTPPSERLRAAAALAAYAPEDPRWESLAPRVLRLALDAGAQEPRAWLRAFTPVRAAFLNPLGMLYRDGSDRHRQEVATEILADFARDRPDMIAELVMDATPWQFERLWPVYSGDSGAVRRATKVLGEEPRVDDTETLLDALARRRSRAAIALVRLEQPTAIWPLLRHRPDPRLRTYLIHALGPYHVPPGVVLQRLADETDVSARRALLLALGEFPSDAFRAEETRDLDQRLWQLLRAETDPGLRAAAEWLLGRRGNPREVAETIQKMPSPDSRGGWTADGEGHTLVRITGPVTFDMGSPASEPNRLDDEARHRCRIPRSFAIAARPVTVEQFERFLKSQGTSVTPRCLYSPDSHGPANNVSWFHAARYCRWLSEREGVPEDQMCYPRLAEIRGGMKLPADYLRRTGYRLPTEAEWEYACRAGATTSRYYGIDVALLPRYAWYRDNADDRAYPCGLLKPNDFGLFDMHGNVWQWTQDRYRPYSTELIEDGEDGEPTVGLDHDRVLRGGAFSRRASVIRSARRNSYPPDFHYINTGLRVARTVK